jgi:hypothetical protein
MHLAIRETVCFTNDNYDILAKVIDSDTLMQLNGLLTERFKIAETYRYVPHLSLAFLKKGHGASFVGRDWQNNLLGSCKTSGFVVFTPEGTMIDLENLSAVAVS